MALPSGAAAKLLAGMAKSGIGSDPKPKVSLGIQTEHLGSGDQLDSAPENDPDEDLDPAVVEIAQDIMQAITSKDAGSLARYLTELIQRQSTQDGEAE